MSWVGTASGSSNSVARSSHYTDASGWGTASDIGSASTLVPRGLGVDASGNAYAYYAAAPSLSTSDQFGTAWARYTAGSGWSGMQAVVAMPTLPSIAVPPGFSVLTYETPVNGLAVFADGSATALSLEEYRISGGAINGNPQQFFDSLPYYMVNASNVNGGMLTYGAVDPGIPASPTNGTPYTYTYPNGTTTTAYYFGEHVVANNLVQAPGAHNYMVDYTDFTEAPNGNHDSYGNPLFNFNFGRGVVAYVSGVPVWYEFSYDPYGAVVLSSFGRGGMAISNNGTGLIAWSEIASDYSGIAVYAARFTGGGWSAPIPLYGAANNNQVTCGGATTNYSCIKIVPVVALNDNGDGVVSFASINGTTVVWRLNGASGTWTAALPAPAAPEVNSVATTSSVGGGVFTQALLNASGDAFLMIPGGVYRLPAGATTFSANALAGPGHTYGGQMALDSSGNPMAVWMSGSGTVYASRYR